MDASQSSMVALDASTIATDSSIPRRRRKRRRTTIVDQLQQINISNGEMGVPNQILEQAAMDDNSQTLTNSSGSEDEDEDNSRILPISDMEHMQRTVMRELVFGRPPEPPPPNVVDRKIQSMVRQSLENLHHGHHPLFLSNRITESQDDMTIDPVYTRPSDPNFFNYSPPPVAAAGGMGPPPHPPPPPPPQPMTYDYQRQRSNSLPEGLMDDLEDAPMEIS